jgi:hypothetical protein
VAPLPPTVGERLVKCETQVDVWGILNGANVDLLIDGNPVQTQNNVASWGTSFTLGAPLTPGQAVTARQSLGGPPSSESPAVIVGDVDLPPPPPRLAPSIYRCSNCVYADGMAPGSTITVFQSGNVEAGGATQVAQVNAGRDGAVCFGTGGGFATSQPVFATATTCGVLSAPSPNSALVDIPGPLPATHIHYPIYACQTAIDMDGLTQGASIEVFASHVSLGSFCNCWGAVHVNLPRALNVNEGITSKQTMTNAATKCNVDGIENPYPVNVIAPNSGIKPGIRGAIYDGDNIIRVTNQISGGDLTLFVKQGATENNAGSAGSSEYEEVSLNNSLVAGQIVRVEQSLCGHTESSDPLTVQSRPSSIPVPVVRAPLYSCGVLVPVDGVLKGAQVRVLQNGFPVGFAWADGTSALVHIGPELVAGKSITATQRVGGVDSLPSAGVPVGNAVALPVPVVLGPLAIGSQAVQVAGVVPGAYVQVFDGGALDGSADAVEGTVTVSLSKPISVGSNLQAGQALCGNWSGLSGPGPSPITDPSALGSFTPSTPSETPRTSFNLPASADAGPETVSMTGELTFPQAPGNPNQVDPSGAPYPLIVIAHGNHDPSSPSYQGYRYLANLLVSQGMICFSANLNDLNGRDDQIDSRALVILQHVRILLQRGATPGDLLFNMLDATRVGLVGHSRGAEAVVGAAVDNMAQPPVNQLPIKGVVPIAPTNSLNLATTGVPLFVIYGSFDADVSGSHAGVNPFFIYDHSQTPKAMIFIHHARHNGFNEVWSRPSEDNEASFPGVLSPLEHQDIAKAYISAFFQDMIFGRTGYEIYLQGPVRPPGLGGYSIHNQYQILNRHVVDNYGDADAQLGIPQKNPIKRETNTLNLAVTYTEAGMDGWFDADMRTVSHNPHDSRGGQLTWNTVDTYVNNVDTRDCSGFAMLSIRLGQQYAPPNKLNPYQQPQDVLVKLKTTEGDATVRAGSITDLPFPDERPDSLTKAPLKTVRVPLASFKAVNPSVRLDQVTGVELDFSPTPFGAVSVDDVEFSA